MKEQKIDSNRFNSNLAKELKAQGAADTSGLLFIKTKSYCVLYRIEDKETYFESKLSKEAPEIYKIYQSLDTIEAGPGTTSEDLRLADLLIQTLRDPYEDHFLLNQDNPGIIYSPGEDHKLEHNLAWVCGVAQANKTAYVLSIPTRKNFLRRQDDGDLSAFAYELGALYKVGYCPRVSSKKRVFMDPPTIQKVTPQKCGIVPNRSDMLSILNALHNAMFPEMSQLSDVVKTNFVDMVTASNLKDLKMYNKKLQRNIKNV